MKLLNEIIEEATDPRASVAGTLRKCLILAFELKNEKLKQWAEKELNGYHRKDEGDIPEYRRATLHSKGNFIGPFGSWMKDRPLPMTVLKPEHRSLLDPAILTEPIASYEINATKKIDVGHFSINWAPDLIVLYQAKYIEGWALSSAWQEIPSGLIVAVVDSVRNRLLRFALELREELGIGRGRTKRTSSRKDRSSNHDNHFRRYKCHCRYRKRFHANWKY